jgi:hypothetical protein
MNQETKQLPVPSLTAEEVQALMNYANEQMPMKWGKEILAFIEKVAIELDKAQNQGVTEAVAE